MSIQHSSDSTPLVSEALSLTTYLTVQLQEIVCMGPGHALTWARRDDKQGWLQASVQGGAQPHIMVQFPCSALSLKSRFDHIFYQHGWTNLQDDGRDCFVYYAGRSRSGQELLAQTESVAEQCAETMRLLWNVTQTEELCLLGARGPRLPAQSKARVQAAPQNPVLVRAA